MTRCYCFGMVWWVCTFVGMIEIGISRDRRTQAANVRSSLPTSALHLNDKYAYNWKNVKKIGECLNQVFIKSTNKNFNLIMLSKIRSFASFEASLDFRSTCFWFTPNYTVHEHFQSMSVFMRFDWSASAPYFFYYDMPVPVVTIKRKFSNQIVLSKITLGICVICGVGQCVLSRGFFLPLLLLLLFILYFLCIHYKTVRIQTVSRLCQWKWARVKCKQ